MAYKAIKNFSGVVSMYVGEVKEIADVDIAKDLLSAGYIEEVKPAVKVKATPTKETKEDIKPATKGKTKRG
jgi:hypothetical protein